jgi:hypothetical protein
MPTTKAKKIGKGSKKGKKAEIKVPKKISTKSPRKKVVHRVAPVNSRGFVKSTGTPKITWNAAELYDVAYARKMQEKIDPGMTEMMVIQRSQDVLPSHRRRPSLNSFAQIGKSFDRIYRSIDIEREFARYRLISNAVLGFQRISPEFDFLKNKGAGGMELDLTPFQDSLLRQTELAAEVRGIVSSMNPTIERQMGRVRIAILQGSNDVKDLLGPMEKRLARRVDGQNTILVKVLEGLSSLYGLQNAMIDSLLNADEKRELLAAHGVKEPPKPAELVLLTSDPTPNGEPEASGEQEMKEQKQAGDVDGNRKPKIVVMGQVHTKDRAFLVNGFERMADITFIGSDDRNTRIPISTEKVFVLKGLPATSRLDELESFKNAGKVVVAQNKNALHGALQSFLVQ